MQLSQSLTVESHFPSSSSTSNISATALISAGRHRLQLDPHFLMSRLQYLMIPDSGSDIAVANRPSETILKSIISQLNEVSKVNDHRRHNHNHHNPRIDLECIFSILSLQVSLFHIIYTTVILLCYY